jgi:ketosteroid isomerase-like protein
MSRENEELIRRSYDAINRRDLKAAKELVDPDCEVRALFTGLDGRTYRGHEGIERWLAEAEESWEDIEQTPERFIEVDPERTIAVIRFRGRGRGSGVQVDQQLAVIATIRDGRAVSVESFTSLAEALEAVGLSE